MSRIRTVGPGSNEILPSVSHTFRLMPHFKIDGPNRRDLPQENVLNRNWGEKNGAAPQSRTVRLQGAGTLPRSLPYRLGDWLAVAAARLCR